MPTYFLAKSIYSMKFLFTKPKSGPKSKNLKPYKIKCQLRTGIGKDSYQTMSSIMKAPSSETNLNFSTQLPAIPTNSGGSQVLVTEKPVKAPSNTNIGSQPVPNMHEIMDRPVTEDPGELAADLSVLPQLPAELNWVGEPTFEHMTEEWMILDEDMDNANANEPLPPLPVFPLTEPAFVAMGNDEMADNLSDNSNTQDPFSPNYISPEVARLISPVPFEHDSQLTNEHAPRFSIS